MFTTRERVLARGIGGHSTRRAAAPCGEAYVLLHLVEPLQLGKRKAVFHVMTAAAVLHPLQVCSRLIDAAGE